MKSNSKERACGCGFVSVFKVIAAIFSLSLLAGGARADGKPPESGSARWHYERALVYVIDESKLADKELEAALAKEANYSEAHYLMATRYADRHRYEAAVQEFRKTLQSASHDHLPARLGLAYSLFYEGELRQALNELIPVAKTLDHEAFRQEIERLQTAILQDKGAAAEKVTHGQIQELLDRIDDFVKTSPAVYRTYTFDRDLDDASVIFDLASLYEDGDNADELLKFLRDAIKRRDGFSPIALISYAHLLKSRKEIGPAAEALEKAIEQLKALGFQEGADFDTHELQELKKGKE